MFNSARVKLTAWYVVILMMVSLGFSGVIYKVLTAEVDRLLELQRYRIERQLEQGLILGPGWGQLPQSMLYIDPELVREIKSRVLFSLGIVNAGIVVVSAVLAWMLAGITLNPIKEMVEEQRRFVSDASHELKTPLTVLKSNLEVNLRDKKLTMAKARQVMEESVEEVNKMQSLSESLVELAAGPIKNVSAARIVDISEPMGAAVKKMEAVASQKNITLITKLEPTNAKADKESVSRVITILVDNAIKYSEAGKEVEIKCGKNDGWAEAVVTDYGIGIDDKDIGHIFDRFFRSDRARTKGGSGGYGLGLAIAKKMVEAQGGEISVSSKPGKGSVFKVKWPGPRKRLVLERRES